MEIEQLIAHHVLPFVWLPFQLIYDYCLNLYAFYALLIILKYKIGIQFMFSIQLDFLSVVIEA